jgi:hypothetical protein
METGTLVGTPSRNQAIRGITPNSDPEKPLLLSNSTGGRHGETGPGDDDEGARNHRNRLRVWERGLQASSTYVILVVGRGG